MQKDYYLSNKIFNHKNVRLKYLYRIQHKIGTMWYYIIQNTIMSWTILSIFGVVPSNMLDFGASICSMIFENVFFWLWKMFPIRHV